MSDREPESLQEQALADPKRPEDLPLDPTNPKTRLLRAIFGFCPDCNQMEEHRHPCPDCDLTEEHVHVEYRKDEEPDDDFPEEDPDEYYYDPLQDYWDGGDLP